MKPSKGSPSVRGKRKLSCSTVDGIANKKTAGVAKRTRSNSNVDTKCVQRSTRSTQSNAFYELPYLYRSRKSMQDPAEETPRRRNKRSSTCSSSSNQSSEAEPASPASSNNMKRGWRRNSTKMQEDDVAASEDQVNGEGCTEESQQSTQDCDCNSNIIDELNVSNGTIQTNGVKELPVDHDCHNLDQPTGALTNSADTRPAKRPYSDSDTLSMFVSSNLDLCHKSPLNGTSHLPLENNASLKLTNLDYPRKRHFSEDTHCSSRRIRRLSERGEMASVIEFVFKNKKAVLAGSTILKSSNRRKAAIKNGTVNHNNLSNEPAASSKLKVGNIACKNAVATCEDEKKFEKDSEPQSKHSSTDEHGESSCDQSTVTPLYDQLQNSHNVTVNSQLNNGTGKVESNSDTESQQSSSNATTHCELNNSSEAKVKSESHKTEDKGMKEVQILPRTDKFQKWRKRSLRSSGIKCQPDYYALSLDLMIHRPRKSKLDAPDSDNKQHTDEDTSSSPKVLEVLSDSEIDHSSRAEFNSSIILTPSKTSLTEIVESLSETDKQTNNDLHSTPHKPNDSSVATSQSPSSSPVSHKSTPTYRGRGRGRGRGRARGRGAFQRLVNVPIKDPFEPLPLFVEEPPTGPEVYFFESDHVALKHNQDYHTVLRSASMLESQRRQALNDLEVLQTRLQESLEDPIAFVDKLQRKVKTDLPSEQNVISLPDIDWLKYTSQFGTFDHVFSTASGATPSKPFTRRKKINFASGGSSDVQDNSSDRSSTSNSTVQAKVRSETFKKSWSVEEQRKLEGLLTKYPQEAVEFNRFRKIAAELGGRTPLQVQSRVQKYFIKLAKAGMHIPGRMPRLDRFQSYKPRAMHRHRTHHQAALTRISTFFTDFHIPVKMRDDDDDDICDTPGGTDEDDGGWDALNSEQVSDEEDVPPELRFSDEYLEILRLKRQRRQQLRMFDNNGHQAMAQHYGFQCDMCQCEPIRGVRYHCIDCPPTESIDLCQSCIRSERKFETTTHSSIHRMEPVYASVVGQTDDNNDFSHLGSPRPFADGDYTKVASSSGEYNYLDPNYLPPTG